MITLRQTDDLDEIRELHSLAFPGDDWVGDDHTFWIAKDGRKSVGFCSAVYRPERGYVFLSRAAVVEALRGTGLQRRMIRTRVNWARKQGAPRCITYTSPKNYPSMLNLIKCGFRFYEPETPYAGEHYHYLQLPL
jgi:GNAT superfamily N-acetyltransferase